MKIEQDKVVVFHYRLQDGNGVEIENSHDGDPVAYLHGHRGVIRGLEQAMAGHESGDVFSAEIEPKLGYGERKEDATQRVPIKHLLTKGKLKPGMAVKINTQQGPRDVVVSKVGRFNVDVDLNHPLAGQTITFDVEIQDVREATAEEIAHGHAHGVGGHQH